MQTVDFSTHTLKNTLLMCDSIPDLPTGEESVAVPKWCPTGCPLKCAYCLNPQCSDENTIRAEYSPKELIDIIEIDDIYFRMIEGGVTFGGGEPLIHKH